MCYRVQSDTHPGRFYRIDLLANNGAGQCSCTDYSTRRGPALTSGKPAWTSASTCKHLRRTAWFFMKQLLKELSIQENHGN